jgi:hypothetical protein
MCPRTMLVVVATDDAVVLQKIETVAGKIRMLDNFEIVLNISERFKLGKG